MNQFGRLRKDEDGHWYVIPESETEAFDAALEALGSDDYDCVLVNDFISMYDCFRLSGGPFDVRVVLDTNRR